MLLTIVLYVILIDIIVHVLKPCFGLLLLSLASMVMRLFTLLNRSIIFKVLVVPSEIFRAYNTIFTVAGTLHIRHVSVVSHDHVLPWMEHLLLLRLLLFYNHATNTLLICIDHLSNLNFASGSSSIAHIMHR